MSAPVQPVASSLCASFVGARVARVTLLDACGRPMWGPKGQCVTKGFVSVEIAPEVEEGESQKVKNAAGELCVSERGSDSISWFTVTVDFCQVDPELFLMMQRSWKRVTDASRQTTTGYRVGERMTDTFGYALELWPKISGGGAQQACLLGDEDVVDPSIFPTGYYLLPWVLGLAPDSFTLENSPASFKIKGRTKAGGLWGRGPYKVTRDVGGLPARLLDPIDPGFSVPAWNFVSSNDPDHFHSEITTVAPPAAGCGAGPVWNPEATAPALAVEAGDTTRTAELTVSNFALTGQSGTVNWGDGNSEPVTSASLGVVDHAYAAGKDGQAQTITYYAGTGAAPVTIQFTPTAP